jgi:HK97 family phage major capsid protein
MKLAEKKRALLAEARKITDLAKAENRALTETETSAFDAAVQEAEALGQTIARDEAIRAQEEEQNRSRGRVTRDETRDESAAPDALRSWLLAGSDATLTDEQRSTLDSCGLGTTKAFSFDLGEMRAAQAVGTPSAGGYLVRDEFSGEVEKALKAFGGMRAVSRRLVTATGADLPWPTVDDTAEEAGIVGENVEITENEAVFGSVTLKAFKYSTGLIKVPLELLQDSAVNIPELVGGLLGERLARGYNRHATTGNGTTQPQGAATGATVGKVAAAVGTVTFDEVLDLIHSVDPAYRENASFMFNDAMLRILKGLKDDQGRPLWLPGVAGQAPATIYGHPYTINQHMDAPAADKVSMLYGAFSKYLIRDVSAVSIVRLDERFAEYGQVCFLGLSRHDGRILDAGQHPIKSLKQAAA